MIRSRKLRIVSFNIFYALRSRRLHRTVPDVFRRLEPDVIALQEVWSGPQYHFAEDLAAALRYHLSFAHRADILGREIGLALLSREKPAQTETVVLPHSRSQKFPRVMHVARYAFPEMSWVVAHAHLESMVSREKRAEQLGAAVRALESWRGVAPTVFAGDFNTRAKAEAEALRKTLNRAEFATPPASPNTWRMLGMKRQLDWIAARDCEIAASGVLEDVKGSDHRPVWADVQHKISA